MGKKKHKYNIRLTEERRAKLQKMTTGGQIGVRKLNRIKILLLADENHEDGHKTDKEIASKLDIGIATAERIRRQYVEEGLEEAINEKPRSGRPKQISGKERAQITALACTTPPEGYGRWSVRLLANKMVELGFIETISHESVSSILKKTLSNPI